MTSIGVDNLWGAQRHRFISFADEHRMPVRDREERNCAQGRFVFLIELTSRMNEPHGGLAAIYYRDSLKLALHKSPVSSGLDDSVHRDRFLRYHRSHRFQRLRIEAVGQTNGSIATHAHITVAR